MTANQSMSTATRCLLTLAIKFLPLPHHVQTSQRNCHQHLAQTLRSPPPAHKLCKTHAPSASTPRLPLTCAMTHPLISAARHPVLCCQWTTSMTKNISNALTQEGQILNPLGDVRRAHALALEWPIFLIIWHIWHFTWHLQQHRTAHAYVAGCQLSIFHNAPHPHR